MNLLTFTNFYHFCVVLHKLLNILHAFSICILCLSKIINYFKTKNTSFSLIQQKVFKNTQDLYRFNTILLLPTYKTLGKNSVQPSACGKTHVISVLWKNPVQPSATCTCRVFRRKKTRGEKPSSTQYYMHLQAIFNPPP